MPFRNLPGIKYLARNNSYSYLALIVIIFLVGITATLLVWHDSESRAANTQAERYRRQLNQSELYINQGLSKYSSLLNDGDALLAINGDNITESQWLAFFQNYNLPVNYPGIEAVSFSRYVPASYLSSYLSSHAAQGEDITIAPSGSRSIYAPITYISYIPPANLKAIGYDELSSPVRALAITNALNTGRTTMSNKVVLATSNNGPSGFVLYKPVYKGAANTLIQRQSSIYGFVSIAVNAQGFFNALLSNYLSVNVAVQVYSGNVNQNTLLYESPAYEASVSRISNPVTTLISTSYGSQTWDIIITTPSSLLLAANDQSATLELVFGVVLSLLVAAVLWYFIYFREKSTYWQKQREIQAAKDELISLASHQLRTPATIVKQYLGILLQNYTGSITKEQQQIIKTAYDSNERQLEIANQFLDAAKLGSGQIKLKKQLFSLNDELKKIVEEQQHIANEHKQKIIFNNPKTNYQIKGDQKYLPMVFENIINNAIKYSKSRTKIDVKIKRVSMGINVIISDQGQGISKAELPLVFEKFSHSIDSRNSNTNGTGIGLYLAKQIANLHDGNITVTSKVGIGSVFTVHLPFKPR